MGSEFNTNEKISEQKEIVVSKTNRTKGATKRSHPRTSASRARHQVQRHRVVPLVGPRPRRPQAPRRGLRASGSSRCSPRWRSTRPPVPVHLEPVAEPRRAACATRSTGERRFARVKVPPLLPRFVRACPTASASCRSSRSSPPTSTRCSRAWRSSSHCAVPRHPQRRPHRRGGGGRRPARRGRDGAAAPPLRPRRPPRDRRRRRRTRSASCSCASSTSTTTTSTCHRGPLDLAGLWSLHAPRPPGAQGPAVVPVTQTRLAARTTTSAATFRGLRERRRARAPPVRLVRDLGRGVHPPGRRTTPTCWPSR